MTTRKNIPAFTILELCVALVLTGVVSSLGYAGFDFLQSQFHLSQGSRENVMECNRLIVVMNNDFFKADEIRMTDNSLDCLKESSTARYTFDEKYVIRDEITPDTFFVKLTDIVHQSISNLQRELLTNFKAEMNVEKELIPLTILKRYPGIKTMKVPNGN